MYKYIVYGLFRKSDDKLLYIGKGNGDYRAKMHRGEIKANRHCNPKLQNTINKLWKNGDDFIEKIMYTNLTNDASIFIEKFLIKYFGKENLCNLTNGGEGAPGRIVSEETREILRQKFKGKVMHPQTEEARRKIGEAVRKRVIKEETRKKLSEAMKRRKKISDETRNKISQAGKGRKWSENQRQIMSKIVKRGSSNHQSKLDEEDVWEIKFGRWASILNCCLVARIFNVTPEAIRHIRSDRNWKHITIDFFTKESSGNLLHA